MGWHGWALKGGGDGSCGLGCFIASHVAKARGMVRHDRTVCRGAAPHAATGVGGAAALAPASAACPVSIAAARSASMTTGAPTWPPAGGPGARGGSSERVEQQGRGTRGGGGAAGSGFSTREGGLGKPSTPRTGSAAAEKWRRLAHAVPCSRLPPPAMRLTRDARHDGGIHHAQPVHALHPQLVVNHHPGLAGSAHLHTRKGGRISMSIVHRHMQLAVAHPTPASPAAGDARSRHNRGDQRGRGCAEA